MSVSQGPLPNSNSADLPVSRNYHDRGPPIMDVIELVQIRRASHEVTNNSTKLDKDEKQRLVSLLKRNHSVCMVRRPNA